MVRFGGELTPVTGEWECMECGYIEEGVEGRRPKQCPECEAPASALEFFPDEDDIDVDRVTGYEDEDEEFEEYDEQEEELEEEEG
jgi:hypothetical protein